MRGGEREPVVVQAGESRSARLESVRALAALGVLIGHVWGTYNGYGLAAVDTVWDRIVFGGGMGVFVFFALTGYLLYWPFVRSQFLAGDRVDIRSYARNRVLRIVPLYVFAVALALVWTEDGGTLRQWVLFLTFSENFSMDTVAQVNGALWSVVVEVHFYLLLPFLAYGLALAARGRLLVVAAILAVIGFVSLQVAVEKTSDSPLWRCSLPVTMYFFVAGMFLALLRAAIERGSLRLPPVLDRSDLWVVLAMPPMFQAMNKLDPRYAAVSAFLLVGSVALPLRHGVAASILGWRPLAFIGVISYSIYALQLPFIEELPGLVGRTGALVLSVPVVLAVSWLTFRLVETPFLRLRKRWAAGAAAQDGRPDGVPREDIGPPASSPEPVAAR